MAAVETVDNVPTQLARMEPTLGYPCHENGYGGKPRVKACYLGLQWRQGGQTFTLSSVVCWFEANLRLYKGLS